MFSPVVSPVQLQDPYKQLAEAAQLERAPTGAMQQMMMQQKMLPLQEARLKAETARLHTQAMMTPAAALHQALEVQHAKNLAQQKIAEAKGASITPLAKAQANRFDKQMGEIEGIGSLASETGLPLLNNIMKLSNEVTTGPLIGSAAWATPKGQLLQSFLTQRLGNYLKTFHLGRMTQTEIAMLKKAQGGTNMYKDALQKLLIEKIKDAKLAVAKQHFYYKYAHGGGINPDEVSNQWSQHINPLIDHFGQNLQQQYLAPQVSQLPTAAVVPIPNMNVPAATQGFQQAPVGIPQSPLGIPQAAPEAPKINRMAYLAMMKKNGAGKYYSDAQILARYDATEGRQ